MKLQNAKRWAMGLALPALALMVLLYELLDGRSLQCPFYQLTGLYCPGCGSGRAVYALLRGELALSFRQNPMLWLLGTPALAAQLYEYLRVVFLPRRLRPIVLTQRICAFLVLLLIAWWILRNLPAFTFLQPISSTIQNTIQ